MAQSRLCAESPLLSHHQGPREYPQSQLDTQSPGAGGGAGSLHSLCCEGSDPSPRRASLEGLPYASSRGADFQCGILVSCDQAGVFGQGEAFLEELSISEVPSARGRKSSFPVLSQPSYSSSKK